MTGPGAVIGGRYRLIRRLAAGGMGSVWEATDDRLHRPVAIKQLHPQPGLSPEAAELARNRAMREARITARLHHPNAVPVWDVVDQDGMPCLVMQYLPSTSLSELLRDKGTLAPPVVARIGAQVAAALAAAHELGIVHRDVKPGNVLIAEDGTAKVTDFGVSHALGDVSLTSTGLVTGTPAFLAPEVARGAETAYSADVFGLGATLYDALEGQPPFGQDDNPMAMLHKAASGHIIPPRRGGPLTPILLRMLAPEPQQRPPMLDVARTLEALATDIDAVTPLTEPMAPIPATQRMTAPPLNPTSRLPRSAPPGPRPPVGALVGPPPGSQRGPLPPPRKPRRAGPIAAIAVLLIVAAALLVALLIRSHDQSSNAGPSGQSSQPPASTTSSPQTNPTQQSSAASTPAASSQPSDSQTSPSQQPSAQPPANPPGKPAAPTDAQLAQAITDYYGLLPGDTDAAWNRLTKKYQHTTAKNRKTYDDFWSKVEQVEVSNVTGSAPSSAAATVTFHFSDGTTEVDQTTFGLVEDAGTLKIDSSQVQNSQSQ